MFKRHTEIFNQPIVIAEPIEAPSEPVDSLLQVVDSLNSKKFIGTWVETYPELFDGKSDTIEFKLDNTIEKHIFFSGWKYIVYTDSILFYNDEKKLRSMHYYFFDNEHEVMMYNFVQSTINLIEKDTPFTKIKND
jgi:hypothetical protein